MAARTDPSQWPLARRRAHDVGRNEIVEAAAIAFSQLGFEKATIDDVGEMLGATKGRVYHYYRSKLDLLLDVLHQGMSELLAAVIPISHGSGEPLAKLQAMVEIHVEMMVRRHAYQDVAISALEKLTHIPMSPRQDQARQRIWAMRDEYEQAFRNVVQEGQAAGEFRSGSSDLAARFILGGLNWITIWFKPEISESEHSVRTITAEFVSLVIRTVSGESKHEGKASDCHWQKDP